VHHTIRPTAPVVSVVTCFLNEERFLGEAVDSVLAQTYASWELLLVDDGSHDRSTVVAREYATRYPDRIRYVEHDRHQTHGLAASRNLGLSHARGEFVAFLDADDRILPRHLERLTGVLESDRDLDAAYCGWTYVTVDGNEAFGAFGGAYGDLFVPHAEYCFSVVHTYLASRALIATVGGFDTSLQSCEDWDLWQRIARAGARFGTVRDKLAAYRIRPGSMTSRGARLLADGLEVIRRGHAADPRVPRPHPVYPNGLPRAGLPRCELDLVCTCAGYEIGGGRDARPLMGMLTPEARATLDPHEVATAITTHALVASGRPKSQWGELWPVLRPNLGPFLEALEARSETPDLARHAASWCRRLVAIHDARPGTLLPARPVRARFAIGAREAGLTLHRAQGLARRAIGVTLSSTPKLRRLVRRTTADAPEVHVSGNAPEARRLAGPSERGKHGEPGLAILAYWADSGTGVDTASPPSVAPALLDSQLLDSQLLDSQLLDSQLRFLREAGYRSTTLDEWRRIVDGAASPSWGQVLLTFDANRDFLETAWPALQRHGFGATVLIASERVDHAARRTRAAAGTPPRLSWPQLRRLQADGVTFASHGVSERDLTMLTLREVRQEIRHSRQVLEHELGVQVDTFAYPAGRHTPAIRYLVGMNGYDYGIAGGRGVCAIGDPLLALPRVDVSAHDPVERLAARLHRRVRG
jgi:peptidoglycan/xylan/chitin deacetylase (PgdA/CDA1 family)/GT2 family glycosyltransferase